MEIGETIKSRIKDDQGIEFEITFMIMDTNEFKNRFSVEIVSIDMIVGDKDV